MHASGEDSTERFDRRTNRRADVKKEKSFYTIVSAGTIQSNYVYDVTFTLHQHDGPVTIDVALTGPIHIKTQTITIEPCTTEVVHFDVPTLESGIYGLKVVGVSGLTFRHHVELNYKDKLPQFYIQTDKAQYKPGDLVQYRVVALDENLKPPKLHKSPCVIVQDGASNNIRQVKDMLFSKGVFTDKFQLSEQPVLGTWKINVELDGRRRVSKKFEVAKYVLPRFGVELETEKRVAIVDRMFKVTVRAKYTYGQPVKGKAKITARFNTLDEEIKASDKTVDVDGKGEVEFDIMEDLQFGHYKGQSLPTINVEAVMTEAFTGNEQKTTATIEVERSRYTITVPKLAASYEVNKPFEITAVIKRLNGSPVTDARSKTKLSLSQRGNLFRWLKRDDGKEIVFESEVDKNGVAVFVIKLKSKTFYHNVKVMYEDKVESLPGFSIGKPKVPKTSRCGVRPYIGALKLCPTTENPALGEEIIIDVKSHKPITYFVYSVVARGRILKHEYVIVEGGAKSTRIRIEPTFEMTPDVNVYAYFIQKGKLEYSETTIHVPSTLLNKLEITPSTDTARPSDMVSLNIRTDPASYVGLLGVDQSVLLLQSGNDLDEKTIINGLGFYGSLAYQAINIPGISSGLITTTNAYIYQYQYCARLTRTGALLAKLTRNEILSLRSAEDEGELDSYKDLKESHLVVPIEPKIRKDFLETWIFDSIESTDAKGLASISKQIPDTITSWVITGFSLNELTGLGMTQNPAKIRVFQPFFLSTNLPYAIKRGEVITIPVIVFNYMESDLDAEITMENSDGEYELIDPQNDNTKRMQKLTIPSNTGETVKFTIRPNIVGEVTLKIKAITPVAGDAIHQKLKVEPEGVTHFQNKAFFISMPLKDKLQHTLKVNLPSDIVPDSEYLEFSVVGDILGPTIKNIDQLVRMPYGCGEQNMVNFVPNILVLHYLDVIKADMPSVVEKAKSYMEKGYQRELTYKHKNGAYSAFGEGHSESNSWLTAYVARSFIQARKYITISNEVIEEALNYLISTQKPNGQFPQTGKLFHSTNQNEEGVSAFILLALLEDTDYALKFKTQIEKALQYLADNVEREDDVYTLSLVALVFHKVKHPYLGKILEKLQHKSNYENNLKWWGKKSEAHNNNRIEVTSYILQTLVETEDAGSVLPIIKWLIGQRNSLGGFDSTQDTVVGLQALIKFAEKYVTGGSGNKAIAFEAHDMEGVETTVGYFDVDKENSLLLQSHVLPQSSRQVSLAASGQGSCLVQLAYRYNLVSQEDTPSFSIKHALKQGSYPGQLLMNVCAEYKPGHTDDAANNESNMAVMEIYLPSGYITDDASLKPIRDVARIQRVETKNADTAIIAYFESLVAGQPICFDVVGEKSHAVAELKPAAITVYDYYETDRRATVYYEVETSLCDI